MSFSPTQLTYEVSDRIATITLNRPDKLNAFTSRMVHEMLGAFDEADADDNVRAVIITGAGRGFCAGADMSAGADTFEKTNTAPSKEVIKERSSRSDRQPAGCLEISGAAENSHVDDVGSSTGSVDKSRDGGGIVSLRIFNSLKPVIGAINGPAVGVGSTMLLPMDIRLASTKARFGFVFTQRGIVPEAASSWFLPRVVGISTALEWCFSGRVFESDEALASGLVRSLHEPEDLIPAARATATQIAENTSAISVTMARHQLWRMLGESHPMAAHRVESKAVPQLGAGADAVEGVTSFFEKRPPNFTMGPSRDMPDVFPWWTEPEFHEPED